MTTGGAGGPGDRCSLSWQSRTECKVTPVSSNSIYLYSITTENSSNYSGNDDNFIHSETCLLLVKFEFNTIYQNVTQYSNAKDFSSHNTG